MRDCKNLCARKNRKVIGVDLQNRGSGFGGALRNINYGGRLISILVFGIARPLRPSGKARGKPDLSRRGTRGWEFAIDLNLSSRDYAGSSPVHWGKAPRSSRFGRV